jgi:hypothetical protein
MRKIYSPAKFANSVLICIARGKMHHIWAESGAFSRAQYKLIQKLQISQGYIFLIFTTFRNQTLQFSSCGDGFCSSCRDQKNHFVLLAEIFLSIAGIIQCHTATTVNATCLQLELHCVNQAHDSSTTT